MSRIESKMSDEMSRVYIKMLGVHGKFHSPEIIKTKKLRARIFRGHFINHLKVLENPTEK